MKTMMDMVKAFPVQLEEAMALASSVELAKPSEEIRQVLVSGMGGSGIGAEFVASFLRNKMQIPFLISKTYDAPAFVNKHTLAIISSYSGNTEETLSALYQIEKAGSYIICISSGGKILQCAKEKKYSFISLPDNWSSPRACLGFSLVAQLYALHKMGLIENSFEQSLRNVIQRLTQESSEIHEKAKHLAGFLYQKRIIIYCTDRIEPVAVRFRQQINENAKMLCWHHVIPEMNHNELVGWRNNDPSLAVIFLRNADDHHRNNLRLELTKDVVSNFAGVSIDVFSKGEDIIERSLYLVHLLDYVSVYLAEMNGIDAVEVKVIDYLKAELGKVE